MFVYILSDQNRRVLYVGVTNNLARRLHEHQSGLTDGFTRRYHVHCMVYFEQTPDERAAIAREKQLKGWRREKKIALIEQMNPEWNDLSDLAFS